MASTMPHPDTENSFAYDFFRFVRRPQVALRSVRTTNLPTLLAQLQRSLVVSTDQADTVILVRQRGDVPNTHFVAFGNPMGITAAQGRT